MSRFIVVISAVFIALLVVSVSHAQDAVATQQITSLDQLLESVRETQQRQRELNAQRERDFLRDNKSQKELIAKAKREFERRQQENQPLFAVTEKNKGEIAALEAQLKALVQEMGDLSSTLHTTACTNLSYAFTHYTTACEKV